MRSHSSSPSILTSPEHTITKAHRHPSPPHPETHTPNTTSEGDTSSCVSLQSPLPSTPSHIPLAEGGRTLKPHLHRRPLTQGGMPKPAILLSCTTPERNLPFPGPIPIPHASFRQRPRPWLAGLPPRPGPLEVRHGRGNGAHDPNRHPHPRHAGSPRQSGAGVASPISAFRARRPTRPPDSRGLR